LLRIQGAFRRVPPRVLAACLFTVLVGCDRGGKLPDVSSKEYDHTVSAFYIGLAALQVGDDVQAESRLAEVTRLAPGEPAGWANWGVLALRQRNFELAAQRLDKAQAEAPKDAHISYLRGLLARNRGDSAQAIADLRKAAELDAKDLHAL
jgi:Flp pilus assembly protein TadD